VYGNVLTVPGAPAEADDAAARASVVAPGEAPPAADAPAADSQWALYEVFTQEAQGAPHEHAGSVRAADPAHALQNARDVYGRRGKVLSMWVVPTAAISATTPGEAEPFFDPGADKPYRHPHFYKTPRGVRGL
jgi:ring-1,2-phenylacetyl-CoA epoxidase subunit PaaB